MVLLPLLTPSWMHTLDQDVLVARCQYAFWPNRHSSPLRQLKFDTRFDLMQIEPLICVLTYITPLQARDQARS